MPDKFESYKDEPQLGIRSVGALLVIVGCLAWGGGWCYLKIAQHSYAVEREKPEPPKVLRRTPGRLIPRAYYDGRYKKMSASVKNAQRSYNRLRVPAICAMLFGLLIVALGKPRH